MQSVLQMNKITIVFITLLAVTSGQNTTNSTTNSTVKTNATTNSTVKTNTTTASLYGSTCLDIYSLCAYNYACSSTCCSALTKRCTYLKSNQKNTMTSLCSVSPSWYPTQPYCAKKKNSCQRLGWFFRRCNWNSLLLLQLVPHFVCSLFPAQKEGRKR